MKPRISDCEPRKYNLQVMNTAGANAERGLGVGDEYRAQISDADVSVLRSMIGNRFYTVYAPCLQVAGAHLTAPSFSIPVFDKITGNWSHRYVVIRCEWSETPVALSDYWQMYVSCESDPHGIEVNSTGAIVAPCTIKYFQATPISKIEIYEFRWSAGLKNGQETVVYDQAIRFEQENGKAFCIACQLDGPGVATEVHISEDEETIRQFLEGAHLRMRVEV